MTSKFKHLILLIACFALWYSYNNAIAKELDRTTFSREHLVPIQKWTTANGVPVWR